MMILKNLFILLLLAGTNAPAYAAVSGVELNLCGVVYDENDNGDDKKEGDNNGGEEEPDCD